MPLSEFIASLQDNPYFGAGFGLVGVGAGLACLRKASMLGMILFRRHCMMTLEIPCRDQSYQMMLPWITSKAKQTMHSSVRTIYKQEDNGKFSTIFDYLPSVGTHFIRHKRTWIKVERVREQRAMDLNAGMPWEEVHLTVLGRDNFLFDDILQEAKTLALEREEGKTTIYTAMGPEWRQFGHPRKRRPLSSVILDEGMAERILLDIKEFINKHKWYSERGIPYRRGYLLHGNPGCGKSSFIYALAGELEYNICILNLSDQGLTDDRLQYLMNVTPQQSIILLEDIDAAFISREESAASKVAYEGLNRVTFSGLLNMLDGVISSEARILFMTTNYIERLDKALIRPGRIDVKERIGYATDFQLKSMFLRFFPEATDSAERFAMEIMKHKKDISMAEVQGLFMCYKNNSKEVLENVNKIGSI